MVEPLVHFYAALRMNLPDAFPVDRRARGNQEVPVELDVQVLPRAAFAQAAQKCFAGGLAQNGMRLLVVELRGPVFDSVIERLERPLGEVLGQMRTGDHPDVLGGLRIARETVYVINVQMSLIPATSLRQRSGTAQMLGNAAADISRSMSSG